MINSIKSRRLATARYEVSIQPTGRSSVMPLLTYTLSQTSDGRHIPLAHEPQREISYATWQQFARRVAREKNLTPFSANVFFERWLAGYAAVAVQDDEIIGHISCLPIYCPATQDAVASTLVPPAATPLPATEMYELLTGWTHPAWRKRGISYQLRHRLLNHFRSADRFHVSVTVGMGGSPVLARLGWRIMAWNGLPFVSGLIGYEGSTADQKGWQVASKIRYDGEHISPFQASTHDWNQFCYFWVSNVPLALSMNENLGAVMDGDLDQWRDTWRRTATPLLTAAGWLPVLFGD